MILTKLPFVVVLVGLVESNVQYTTVSPNGNVTAYFMLDDAGVPKYEISLGEEVVIPLSAIGFELTGGTYPSNSLYDGWEMATLFPQFQHVRSKWSPIRGESAEIEDNYNSLMLRLRQRHGERRSVAFHLRVYDIGVAFQFELAGTFGEEGVKAEKTEFRFKGDPLAWWSPGDYDAQDYGYFSSRLSEIAATISSAAVSEVETLVPPSPAGESVIATPVTIRTDEGVYISIHEAGGDVFASMNLRYDSSSGALVADLVPDATGVRGVLSSEMRIPWRAIMVTRDPTQLLSSRLILNLNDEPSDEAAAQSITPPTTSVGVWWEMVSGNKTWRYTDDLETVEIGVTDYRTVSPNGVHGVTTDRVLEYVDFAAANGIGSVMVEGWNEGWEDWTTGQKEVVFDFFRSYPDYDESWVAANALCRGVQMVKHHETAGAITDYEKHLPAALADMAKKNYSALRVGYHGALTTNSHHLSQDTNRHYREVIEQALRHNIGVSMHAGLKPTGLSRKYPNLFSTTATRTNAHARLGRFSGDFSTIIPFNHLIGGPVDFGAGLATAHMINSTIVHQFATMLVYYTPNPFIADTPENLSAVQPLVDLVASMPSTWRQSIYVAAVPDNRVLVAREAMDGTWFVGGIVKAALMTTVRLSFLEDNTKYLLDMYGDGHPYDNSKLNITNKEYLIALMEKNGGFIGKLTKLSSDRSASAEY